MEDWAPLRHYELHRIRVVELTPDGAPLRNGRDAVDAIAAASPWRPEIIVIPIERFDPDFFRLRTGIAGQVIQKFITYRLRLVIMGGISTHQRESSALREFVYESNRGSHVWFVTRLDELSRALQRETDTP
jgi:Domain of unknown function (DUF4180)